AGTMGSRIAAHIANAGLPVVLLDIVPPEIDAAAPKQERNRIVLSALDGLKKSKPAAFYAVESAKLITPGNFQDDMGSIADCDWII
ncbi:3-hydroxyacyl-CoA dehydrogenase, partial [Pseudomonas sp. FW306-2-11BA]